MQILLVWPRNERAVLSDRLSCCEPLPLEYLAAALRSDHDVRIHDLRLDGPLPGTGPAPNLVGVAVPYTTNVHVARDAAAQARQLWPQATIVLGGHHPTVSGAWLDGFAADYVIAGDGCGPLRDLADSLENRRAPGPVPGLAPYGQRHLLVRGAVPNHSALNDLPLPDRTMLSRHHDRYFHSVYRPVALARLSAGCPYTCNFCSLWRLTSRRYLVMDADRVLADLSAISQRNVYVVDDEAFIQPHRMLELSTAIAGAGITHRYHMYVRTDTALRRPDVVEAWARIGLDSVLVGAESMTRDELIGYRKGTAPQQTVEALALFHGLGVRVRANFIVQPGWGEAEFDQLLRTVEELEVDMPSFSVLTPLPGTELYDATRAEFISNDPELFDCYHTLLPTRLPLPRFYARLAQLLDAAGARPSVGLNHAGDPAVFYYSDRAAFEQMLAAVRRGHVDTTLSGPPSADPASADRDRLMQPVPASIPSIAGAQHEQDRPHRRPAREGHRRGDP